MIRPLALTLALATAAVQPAAAQVRFQDTTAIDVAVQAFTGHRIGEEGGARSIVDKRLKLAACELPQLEWRGTYQDSVVVRCDAPAWRIFVPVLTPPRAVKPIVATVTPAGPLATPVAAVRPEPVIRRGDPVTLEASSAGFSITRDAVAMGDAPAGGRLMVKVDPTKPPVQAVAIESGRAQVPGWSK